jgi:hypothetical protein
VLAELLVEEADLSLEEAAVHAVGRLEALSELALASGTGLDRGLCTTWFTGEYRIRVPDAAGPDGTPRPPRPNR